MPGVIAVTVVMDNVQTPIPLVKAQVMAPEPLEPLSVKAAVSPRFIDVGLAAAMID
jgi:hypothetical protein